MLYTTSDYHKMLLCLNAADVVQMLTCADMHCVITADQPMMLFALEYNSKFT
jgi:hypothetical protein